MNGGGSRRVHKPPNSPMQPTSGRYVGPAAELPWPNTSVAASRRLHVTPAERSLVAATGAPLCRCEREAARS